MLATIIMALAMLVTGTVTSLAQPEPSFRATCSELRAAVARLELAGDPLITIQVEGRSHAQRSGPRRRDLKDVGLSCCTAAEALVPGSALIKVEAGFLKLGFLGVPVLWQHATPHGERWRWRARCARTFHLSSSLNRTGIMARAFTP